MRRVIHPFLKPTALEANLLRELVATARLCFDRGWTAGTAGNFSLRIYPDLMWVSQSGLCKGELRWDRFIPLQVTKEKLKSIEALYRKPSDESALHSAIYRSFPEAQSVVHVHPVSIVKASQRRGEMVFDDLEMQKALGAGTHDMTLRIPVIDNTQDISGLARKHQFVKGVPLLVLRGHGVYSWARTPRQALNFVEGLDHLCQTIG